jgi:hypothetical protein
MLTGFVYTLDKSREPNYHCSDIQGCIKKVIQIWHVIVYYVHPLISVFHTNKDQGPVV